ncbi:MAG: O-antigen ligase family protein [Verrucomicrobiae bacterium]|nr:O-antigen ligase family protein [Verrucomicrobiae bacterium]
MNRDPEKQPRRPLHLLAVAGTAALCFLAPLKFTEPVILYYLDTLPQNLPEWFFFTWPNSIFHLLLIPVALFAWFFTARDKPARFLRLAPALFVASQFLACLGTAYPGIAWNTFAFFLAMGVGFLLGARLFREPSALRPLLLAWILGGLWVALEGVSQANGGLQETREFFERNVDPRFVHPDYIQKVYSDRIFSTFGNPNALGGFAISTVFAAAAWFALARPPEAPAQPSWKKSSRQPPAPPQLDWRKVCTLSLALLVILTLLYCLWKTQSKGAFLSLFFSLVCCAALFAKKTGQFLKWTGLILLAAVVAFGAGYGQKAVEKGQKTFAARLGYWHAALRIGADHPLLGTGPGTFCKTYFKYKRDTDEDTKLAHNSLLQMWCDSGLSGLIAFVFWFPGSLFLWWKHRRRIPPDQRTASTLLWCACLAFGIHSLVEFNLYVPGLAWPIAVLSGFLASEAVLSPGTSA